MAAGVRILLNFHRCRGPITVEEGVEEGIRKAHKNANVTVLEDVQFRNFPDGTTNFHSDLAESHCSGGTYLKDRFVSAEVSMCHETKDNTELARALANELKELFQPGLYSPKDDWTELPWESK